MEAWLSKAAYHLVLRKQMCEVVLSISDGSKTGRHKISAKLTQEGNREYKIDNGKRALKEVKVR